MASVSSPEIVEELAYDRIEIAEGWLQHAHLCHLIESIVRGDKARPPEAFLPERLRPRPKPMTPAEMKARFRAAAAGGAARRR